MKTILTLLFLASVGLNVLFLAGCVSTHATRLYPQKGLSTDDAGNISNSLDPDNIGTPLKAAFDREHAFYESVKGTIVISIPNTEEIRNAKRVLLYFDDAD